VVELVIRVVFSLAVVLGLLWVIARTSSRRFGGPGRSLVRVVARQSLARTASLAVVEVGERILVVGVSENGVSLLTEMDPSELPAELPTEEAAPVAQPIDRQVGRQVARHVSRNADERGTGVGPVAQPGLAGSVLSPQTWRQAWAAATSRPGGSGD
jgi:flagellar protein FliO/FliZ